MHDDAPAPPPPAMEQHVQHVLTLLGPWSRAPPHVQALLHSHPASAPPLSTYRRNTIQNKIRVRLVHDPPKLEALHAYLAPLDVPTSDRLLYIVNSVLDTNRAAGNGGGTAIAPTPIASSATTTTTTIATTTTNTTATTTTVAAAIASSPRPAASAATPSANAANAPNVSAASIASARPVHASTTNTAPHIPASTTTAARTAVASPTPTPTPTAHSSQSPSSISPTPYERAPRQSAAANAAATATARTVATAATPTASTPAPAPTLPLASSLSSATPTTSTTAAPAPSRSIPPSAASTPSHSRASSRATLTPNAAAASTSSSSPLNVPPPHLCLHYGDRVVLRSPTSHVYVDGGGNAHSSSSSSCSFAPVAYILLNARKPSDRHLVHFFDSIYLVRCVAALASAGPSALADITSAVVHAAAAGAAGGAANASSTSPAISDLGFLVPHADGVHVVVDTQPRAWTILPPTHSRRNLPVPVHVRDLAQLECNGAVLTSNDDGGDHAASFSMMRREAAAAAAAAAASSLSSPSSSPTDPTTLQLVRADLPFVPEWLEDAESLPSPARVQALFPSPIATAPDASLFHALDARTQDRLLVEDALYALIGLPGRYIDMQPAHDGRIAFVPGPTIADSALVNAINRILPLCSDYHYVHEFVHGHSHFEYGLVNHALCAAIDSMLQEYLVLVSQLEHQHRTGHLTLLNLFFYVQDAVHSMGRLAALCARVQRLIGGQLLDALHQCAQREGETRARAMYAHLTACAAVPYLSMLERWIYHGVIDDAYREFQVRSHVELSKHALNRHFNDTYWDERFVVRSEHVPSFLQPVAEHILTTGKYLNVVRECGRPVHAPPHVRQPIVYHANARDYIELVDRALEFASRELLDLLMNEHHLVQRLRSIKRYFLLDQGDLYVQFMDIAEDELRKPIMEIGGSKLRSLLELALRTSKAVVDPFHEDLSCFLVPNTLVQQQVAIDRTLRLGASARVSGRAGPANDAAGLASAPDRVALLALTGLDCFSLSYRVEFPLSLILSKTTLAKYQLLFRLLFTLKHAERQVCHVWRVQKNTGRLVSSVPPSSSSRRLLDETYEDALLAQGGGGGEEGEDGDGRARARAVTRRGLSGFGLAFGLRQRMLHVLQNVLYYIMAEVLEPSHHTLMNELRACTTLDAVLQHHARFLDVCLRQCMLTSNTLLRLLFDVLNTCSRFCAHALRVSSGGGGGGSVGSSSASASAIDEDDEELGELDGDDEQRRQRQEMRATRKKLAEEELCRLVQTPEYRSEMVEFASRFDAQVVQLMHAMKEASVESSEPQLLQLLTRLDYNLYYSRVVAKATVPPAASSV